MGEMELLERRKKESLMFFEIRKIILDALRICGIEYDKLNVELSKELNERIEELIQQTLSLFKQTKLTDIQIPVYSITKTNPEILYKMVADLLVQQLTVKGIDLNDEKIFGLVKNICLVLNKIIDHERANRLSEIEHTSQE